MLIETITADLTDPLHAAAVLALIDEYAQEPVVGQARPLDATVRDRLIPRLAAHPTTHIILARQGSRFVGIAVCFFGFSTFNAAPLLNVHDLAVTRDCRGNGVGAKLLLAVESAARQAGCCKVTLEVNDNNPARKLYERCGFVLGVVGQDAQRFMTKRL